MTTIIHTADAKQNRKLVNNLVISPPIVSSKIRDNSIDYSIAP